MRHELWCEGNNCFNSSLCSTLESRVQEIEQIFGDGFNFSSYLEPYLGPIHLESQLVFMVTFLNF